MGNMMCNSEAICKASEADLLETAAENKRKQDGKEKDRLDRLLQLQIYVQLFMLSGDGALKAADWKKIITFVLPAADQGSASKYTKVGDIKKRLEELDRPWHAYIPLADGTVETDDEVTLAAGASVGVSASELEAAAAMMTMV